MFLEVVGELARTRVLPLVDQVEDEGIPSRLRDVIDEIELVQLAGVEEERQFEDAAPLALLALERIASASASVAVDLAARQAGFLAATLIGRQGDEAGTLLAIPSRNRTGEQLVIGGSGGEDLIVATSGGIALVDRHVLPEGVVQRRLGLHGVRFCAITPTGKEGDLFAEAKIESAFVYLSAALAVCSVGVAARAIEVASAYARERRQFGRSIIEFGAVEAGLTTASADVDSCLSPLCSAISAAGATLKTVQSLAERCADFAIETCDLAIQTHGGYGYIEEYEAERLFRDSVTIRALLLGIS